MDLTSKYALEQAREQLTDSRYSTLQADQGQSLMKTPKINWREILTVHMHGIEAKISNRHAEVIRAYPREWFAYLRIDGAVCKREEGEPRYESKAAAKRRAERFLRGETTPATWPKAPA